MEKTLEQRLEFWKGEKEKALRIPIHRREQAWDLDVEGIVTMIERIERKIYEANKIKEEIKMETPMVIADNGVQFFVPCDVEVILSMSNDYFVNEHNSKEYRYTDNEVCENFNISIDELNRIKYTQSYEYNN